MDITEQRQRILRQCFKIQDYKLGDTEQQVQAYERRIRVLDDIKAEKEQLVIDRLRVIAHLKTGEELKIDHKNDIEVQLFVNLKNEELIDILEKGRNNFVAKWKQ